MTSALDRLRFVWWSLLGVSALVLSFSGWESPTGAADSGRGYVVADYLACAMLWVAAIALTVRRLIVRHEHPLIVAGTWAGLLTLTLYGGRMAWMLASTGDPRLSITALLSLICLAAWVMLDSAGHIDEAIHRRGADDTHPAHG